MRLFEYFKLSGIEFQHLKRSRSLICGSDCGESAELFDKVVNQFRRFKRRLDHGGMPGADHIS
jgi:hypothetical protein